MKPETFLERSCSFSETKLRCEADYYGFSQWLSELLGIGHVPVSIRGFQHYWVFLRFSEYRTWIHEMQIPQHGILVQDNDWAAALRRDGVFAVAAGSPFQTFIQNTPVASFVERVNDTLFVPSHSVPTGGDYSGYILKQVEWAAERCERLNVLLSYTDRNILDKVRRFARKVEIGAGVNEIFSFYRISRVFCSYERMLTTSVGSHLLYGSLCGMNVRLRLMPYSHFRLVGLDGDREKKLGIPSLYESEYVSENFLRDRIPGLLDDFSAKRPQFPLIKCIDPTILAILLGWNPKLF
jgi:hypothetical protein